MPPAPSAAKIAAESRIDLASVAGSGKRGQVLKSDALAAAPQRPRQSQRSLRRPRPPRFLRRALFPPQSGFHPGSALHDP